MVDLIVRGGRVVAPWGAGDGDVLVEREKIVAVAGPGTFSADSARLVDATGKVVVPGAIEPHAHASLPFPYPGARDRKVHAASPDVISKACIFGGWPVTRILRGKVVVENGKLVGDLSDGRLIGDRKTPAEVLRGPAF